MSGDVWIVQESTPTISALHLVEGSAIKWSADAVGKPRNWVGVTNESDAVLVDSGGPGVASNISQWTTGQVETTADYRAAILSNIDSGGYSLWANQIQLAIHPQGALIWWLEIESTGTQRNGRYYGALFSRAGLSGKFSLAPDVSTQSGAGANVSRAAVSTTGKILFQYEYLPAGGREYRVRWDGTEVLSSNEDLTTQGDASHIDGERMIENLSTTVARRWDNGTQYTGGAWPGSGGANMGRLSGGYWQLNGFSYDAEYQNGFNFGTSVGQLSANRNRTGTWGIGQNGVAEITPTRQMVITQRDYRGNGNPDEAINVAENPAFPLDATDDNIEAWAVVTWPRP